MIKFILLASRTLRHSVKTGISILIRQLGFIVWLNQSGYLTIKGYDSEFGIYQLGFPNREVEGGFMVTMTPSSVVCKVSLRTLPTKSFVTGNCIIRMYSLSSSS